MQYKCDTFVGDNPERTSVPIMFAPEHLKYVQKLRTIISESKHF